jgi:hypothetical protein
MIETLEDPFLALSLAVSVGLILHLWLRRAGSLGQKILWSVALMVPLLGALFYLALYSAPPVQPEHLRAREHPDLWAAPTHHDASGHRNSIDHHD